MILEGYFSFFIIGLFYFVPVVLCCLFDFNAITTRDLKLHLVLAFLNFMSISSILTNTYIEKSDINCAIGKLVQSIQVYPYFTCYIMMSLSLVMKYKTNYKIGDSSLQMNNLANKTSGLLTYRGYKWYVIVIVMAIAHFIGLMDYYLNYGIYLRCTQSLTSTAYASSALYILMTLYLYISLRKIRDQYLIRFELLACGTVFVLFLILLGISTSVFHVDASITRQFVVAMMMINHLVCFCSPLVVIWRYKQNISTNSTVKLFNIATIWSNPVEKDIFKGICAKYFVIENFMFLEWYDQSKSDIDCYAIGIQLFVDNGSPYELNIDESLRNKALNAITISDFKSSFDSVKAAVSQMLVENIVPKYLMMKSQSKSSV